ncbi:hypothetical protein C7271_05975 [filamentous cyanobacterium CCP5]|nr:hypothetical protein C7271_05975 [filamentous cyanobacterium CCP5]
MQLSMLATVEPYWLENGTSQQPVQTVDNTPIPKVMQGILFDLDEQSRWDAERRQFLTEDSVAP